MNRMRQPDATSMIVRVALPLPLPQTFDYLPGSGVAQPGCRVRVPFGHSRKVGVVLEATAAIDLEGSRKRMLTEMRQAGINLNLTA